MICLGNTISLWESLVLLYVYRTFIFFSDMYIYAVWQSFLIKLDFFSPMHKQPTGWLINLLTKTLTQYSNVTLENQTISWSYTRMLEVLLAPKMLLQVFMRVFFYHRVSFMVSQTWVFALNNITSLPSFQLNRIWSSYFWITCILAPRLLTLTTEQPQSSRLMRVFKLLGSSRCDYCFFYLDYTLIDMSRLLQTI